MRTSVDQKAIERGGQIRLFSSNEQRNGIGKEKRIELPKTTRRSKAEVGLETAA